MKLGSHGYGEAVEIEGRAEVGARRRLFGLERDPGRVCDTVDRIEEADHPRRIDQSRCTQRLLHCAARPDQRYVVIPEHRFGKGDEEAAVRNPAVAVDNAGDRAEIIRPVMGGAARTEQQGMTGGSIETLVERRHPCRQQLDLGMADRPVFVSEVAHDFAGQVLVADEVEKATHLVRH